MAGRLREASLLASSLGQASQLGAVLYAGAVAFTVPIDADLGEDYLMLAQPMVDQQLALAGLRLARTLNEIFK